MMSFISKNVHSYNIKWFGVFYLVYKWFFLLRKTVLKLNIVHLHFFFTYCELTFFYMFMLLLLIFTETKAMSDFLIFLCPSSILHNKIFSQDHLSSETKLGWHTLQTIEVLSTGHNFIVLSWNWHIW